MFVIQLTDLLTRFTFFQEFLRSTSAINRHEVCFRVSLYYLTPY